MSILDFFGEPPGVQNGALERPGRPKMSKLDVTFSPARVFFRPRRALRSKWVPEATLVDFGTPLGHLGRHFATHWGSQGSIFERILAASKPFLNISTLQLSTVT